MWSLTENPLPNSASGKKNGFGIEKIYPHGRKRKKKKGIRSTEEEIKADGKEINLQVHYSMIKGDRIGSCIQHLMPDCEEIF